MDLHLEAAGTRILVRLPGNAAQAIGTSLGIAPAEAADAVAFPV